MSWTRRTLVRFFAATPLMAWAALGAAHAQDSAPALDRVEMRAEIEEAAAPRDSARTLRDVRAAQASFERRRRGHFPWVQDRWGGRCDERVGRFCLYHPRSDRDTDWSPPDDPDEVRDARQALISEMVEALTAQPGDAWIAGHTVGYLVEDGQLRGARVAAETCRAERWWCTALAGYALHAAEDFAAADTAFLAALADMPEEERRRWTDLSELMEPGDGRAYRRMDDDEREAFEARFWWLADPLYMVDGNERRTEHFSRHVWARLQSEARSTDGTPWGDDLYRITIRWGSPVAWERVRPRTPRLDGISLISRYPPRSRPFSPARELANDPLTARDGDLSLGRDRSRARYAPSYVRTFERDLRHQVAVFRRGDSLRVVAGYELPEDTASGGSTLETALFLFEGERGEPTVARETTDALRGTLHLTAPAGHRMMSLEVRAEDGSRAARARYAVVPPPDPPAGVVALSDMLVLEPGDALPEALDQAVPQARGSNRVRAGDRVSFFWEVYGLENSRESLRFAVSLGDEERGLLRRLGERIGLLRSDDPVRTSWEEHSPGDGSPMARSLTITIPELDPGVYTLRLNATAAGRETVVSERSVEVVTGDPPD